MSDIQRNLASRAREKPVPRTEQGAATHVGRRPNNEDAYRLAPELGLYVVADGLGGYEGGEVASGIAVQTVVEFIGEKRRELDRNPALSEADRLSSWEKFLVEGALLANRRIVERQAGNLGMMGSTLAAILIPDSVAIVCHVGDSRVYFQRENDLRQLTRDHTLYEEIRARGVDLPEAQRVFYRNELTRALGLEGTGEPEVSRVPIRTDDVFLICTDGVYDVLSSEQIGLALRRGSPQEMTERLVREAYEQGGTDNITAVVIRVLD